MLWRYSADACGPHQSDARRAPFSPTTEALLVKHGLRQQLPNMVGFDPSPHATSICRMQHIACRLMSHDPHQAPMA